MIRLRDAYDEKRFLPWESVLGTLIHELTHNAISEHSAEFYKMMDELWNEFETYSSGGYNNFKQGASYKFDGGFNKLGNRNNSSQVSTGNLSKLAAEAALKRQMNGSNGVHKLGGGEGFKTLTPQELKFLAAKAADRRMRDETSCSTRSLKEIHQVNNLPSKRQSDESWMCKDCLDKNILFTSCNYCGSDEENSNDNRAIKKSMDEIKLIDLTSGSPDQIKPVIDVHCKYCTFINKKGMTICEICDSML